MRKKLIQFGFAFLIPTSIMLGTYIYFDPFRVVQSTNLINDTDVPINRDYVSTELFNRQYETEGYNSFVFGSSRTISVYANDWYKYLPSGAKIYKYDASGENIYGIFCKLKYLNSIKDIKIKNCLIFICRDANHKGLNSKKHLGIKHPNISNESWIEFHFQHLKMYFNFKFLVGYFYFKATGNINSSNEDIIQLKKISLEPKTNQILLDAFDYELNKDEFSYYKKNEKLFELEVNTEEKIKKKREKEGFNSNTIEMLKEIKSILEIQKTDYKIVLSPIFDKLKFDETSKNILKSIFPENRIYDFTGENYITKNKYYWYENYHFRPFIGDSILKTMYSQ